MLNEQKASANSNANKVRSIFGLSGLVLVFVAVTFANQNKVDQMEEASFASQERGIASISIQQDLSWKKNLSTRLSEMSQVPSGKAARPANSIENFAFGQLKGHYLMGLQGEKVSEMILKQSEVSDAARMHGEEVSFLEKNKEVWWVDFENLELKERSQEKSVIKLMDSAKSVIGEASFSWDTDGRLLSLKIDKL